MTTAAFDPLLALRILNRRGVDYIVIGGFAGDLLGAPLNTNDLDICYDRSPANLEKLAAALVELEARLRVPGVDEELPFILDARTLANGDCFTFETEAGALDALGTPAGTNGFRDLRERAHVARIRDLEVLVADLGDLMRMKRASGRIKDRLHLEVLAALREMLDER